MTTFIFWTIIVFVFLAFVALLAGGTRFIEDTINKKDLDKRTSTSKDRKRRHAKAH